MYEIGQASAKYVVTKVTEHIKCPICGKYRDSKLDCKCCTRAKVVQLCYICGEKIPENMQNCIRCKKKKTKKNN